MPFFRIAPGTFLVDDTCNPLVRHLQLALHSACVLL